MTVINIKTEDLLEDVFLHKCCLSFFIFLVYRYVTEVLADGKESSLCQKNVTNEKHYVGK